MEHIYVQNGHGLQKQIFCTLPGILDLKTLVIVTELLQFIKLLLCQTMLSAMHKFPSKKDLMTSL